MEWNMLLSSSRLRELAGGRPTTRPQSEARSEIERDYGRAVFSTPVRRLQDKAQVFPLEPIDAVRTRLTHSLEVSAVARGLASRVAGQLFKRGEISLEQACTVETVAATCGLLHDIGNPPFGHFGENAIRDWFKEKNTRDPNFLEFDCCDSERLRDDLLNFEGNAQTIRLLCKLQVLSDRYGLNLTAATASAMLKYTANSTEIGVSGRQSKKKLGFFTSEQDIIEMIRNETGTGDARNPITLLVEAADDIVYSIVDIEDGIKKGVVTWECVKDNLNLQAETSSALDILKRAENKIGDSDLPLKGHQRDEGIAQYFRTFLISDALKAVESCFLQNYRAIMSGDFDKEILYESEIGAVYSALKSIGRSHVYNSKETLRLELLGYNVIHSLMDIFARADGGAKSSTVEGKAYALMSSNYKMIFETDKQPHLPDKYRKMLLLTDYVSGMTDSFALNLHAELVNGG